MLARGSLIAGSISACADFEDDVSKDCDHRRKSVRSRSLS